jgi:predicted DNA-binding transcriptional regulator YafY
MAQFAQIERLYHLLNFIKYKYFPTKNQLLEYLAEKDFVLTERSLERDLKLIREKFFIDVIYDRSKNGYFIDTNSTADFNDWIQLFQLVVNYQSLNETLIQLTSKCDYIDFDRSVLKMNPEFLKLSLNAIIQKQKLSFNYTNYATDESKNFIIQPVLLKEFQHRWYVCGNNEAGEFRSFGLDRISNLIVLQETFRSSIKNPKALFDKIIGLSVENDPSEKIVLSFHPLQGKYILSQPIHLSQKIVLQNENELRISINVIPNYELLEQILKHGDRVKVMEPAWLKSEIIGRLTSALNQY